MRLRCTERFVLSLASVNRYVRPIAEMQLRRFAEDPYHPAVRLAPIDPQQRYWQISVNSGYRIVWRRDDVEPDLIILLELGTRGTLDG